MIPIVSVCCGKRLLMCLFAATPPLFATKMIISDAASRGDEGKGERALQVIDVKTAFLYGEIKDKVFQRPQGQPLSKRKMGVHRGLELSRRPTKKHQQTIASISRSSRTSRTLSTTSWQFLQPAHCRSV